MFDPNRKPLRIETMRTHKTVLITGASSGIGEALALHYLQAGSTVALCGRNAERLDALCEDRPNAHALVFDITDADAAAARIGAFLGQTGGIDLAVLNAGDHEPTDGAALRAVDYMRLMDVNYRGALNCLEPLIPAMKARGEGIIALMGSLAGYTGLTHAGAYSASKSAVMRLAETLRAELSGYGVDVRLISPGFVKTPLTGKNEFPMPFLMELDDAVARIVRGLDGRRFEIAFPRRLALSLRLLSLLPRPLYFRVLRSMLKDNRET